ncbi:hypothetical protein HCB25_14395 [Listeria booriae]|uniref:Uncharacterized protein n=1 Tax=Listeria booriae TaxID=1552123 RepID=A0A842FNG7_9LIST|nr:toxin Cry1Ac domain D-VI-related protein [Listeria booriae]MBC2245271.1 hypothetical protein [Listeria booriae]
MKKSGKKILTGTAAAMLALSAVAAPVATVVTNPSETKAAAVRFTDVRLVMIGGQLYVQASYNTYNVKEQITVGIVPEYGPTQGIAVVTPDSSKQSLIPVTKKIVAGDRIFVLFIGSNGVQIDGVVLAADEFMDIQAISNAEAAINNLFTTTAKTAIKSTTNQAAINSAQLLVNEVLNDTKRAALQQDINKAQQLLNARTESDNQAAARTAVNQLFINNTPTSNAIKDITTQASINAARALVNKVTDAAVRNALEADLKKAQDLLDYNANQQINQAAQTAVNELFKDNQPATGAIKDTTTQATIDAAQKLVDAVKDQSLKNTLQENINKAKDLLTDGGAQAKAREAVNNLFGNKDPKGNIKAGLTQAEITNAQSLVDKVSDAVKKAELQADLDKAKKEFNQTGTNFTYTFKNKANNIFATMDISITNMQAVTATKSILTGGPINSKYASILIQSGAGTEKFNKTFWGINTEVTERTALSVGDFITTYHSEFSEDLLTIQNNVNKGPLETRVTITYMVTATGLVLVNEIEKETVIAGNKAREAVNKLFVNKDPKGNITAGVTQTDIQKAQDLVDAVQDLTKRAELQSDLNKAKAQLDAKIKADQERQAAADKAINELFKDNKPSTGEIKDTTNQQAIDDAQKLVDVVEDVTAKKELQANLDKVKELLDAKIAAEKAANEAAKKLVDELFTNDNPATNAIKAITNQQAINDAKAAVAKVTDPALKATLEENIELAQKLLNERTILEEEDKGQQLIASFLVKQLYQNNDPKTDAIKSTTNQISIDTAQEQVDLIRDPEVRAQLQKEVDRAQELLNARLQAEDEANQVAADKAVNELFKDNKPSTGEIKDTTDQASIDAAQKAIDAIKDPVVKDALQANLDKAQELLNAKKAEEKAEQDRQAAADKAVNELFKDNKPSTGAIKDTTDQDAIDAAQKVIDAVKDQATKDALQANLDKAQELLNAKKAEEKAEQDRQAAADKAVNELFKDNKPATGTIKDTTDQAAIDAAQKVIDAVKDQATKDALQANLDKAQELLNAKKAEEKAEQDRQNAADKAINELFKDNKPSTGVIKDTTDQKAIDEAQKLIDAVTDPTMKQELQNNLDKVQELLDAKKAEEKAEQDRQAAADKAVNELFKDNKPATGTIKDTTDQAAIDAAQKVIDAVKDQATKDALQANLDKAQELLNAKKAEEKAEQDRQNAADKAINELFKDNKPSTGVIKDTTDQKAIDEAQKLIDAVTDPTMKQELQNNLDKVQELLDAKKAEEKAEQDRQAAADKAVNELFKDNKPATGAIKDTTDQDAIDAAQKVIDAVKDQATKDALQAHLDKAQELLNAKKAEQDRQNEADKAINELFKDNNPATGEIKDTTDQTAIDEAQKIIDKVTDPAVKQELQNNLDKAQELLNEKNSTEKEDQAAANKAVNELFKDNDPKTGAIKDTTNQDAIDAAQKLIDAVKDPETNAALQANLDKAQELLDAKTAADKAEQARQAAAEKAVNELFNSNKPSTGIIKDATDQTAIDAAQKLIDAVTVPSVKKELQTNLDKAQNLLDTKFFNAAQEAVQGLMTTLVNFGQKTDAYGAIKLDTTQEKIYQAQDKVSLVPDRVAEKANLIAQLDKVQEQLIARNNEQIGNKVNNGNFDSALNGWKTWIGSGSVAPTVAATEGPATKTVKLASNSSVEQTIQGLKPNTNYVITFYGKVDDGTFLSAGIKNHGNTQQSIRVTTADYSKGQIAFTTGASATSATFFLMKGAGTGNGFGDFVISKADNGEDLIPEVIEATNKVDNLFTNLSVTGVNDTTATLYKNGALKLAVKQADINAAMAVVNAMQDSYESKADLLATLKTAQNLWNDRTVEQTDNLVKNSEFDSSIANWKPWNGATSTTPVTVKEDSNNVLKLAGSSSVEQVISGLKPNTTYTLEIYGKADNNGYVSVGVKNYGGTQKTARVSGADYTKASVTIRTGATNTTATVFLLKGAGISAGSVDTVLFKDSTPESERPEVIAANEALTALFTSRTSVSTEFLTPVTTNNGAIKMTTTEEDLAAATAAVEAVPTGLKSKAIFEAELARATTLFTALKASQTDNLTKNGAFDTNLTSWKTWKAATAETPVVVTENDNKVLKLEGNSSVEQTITGLLPNTTYTVSTYGKVENGARLSVGVKSYGGVQANAFVTSTDYGQGTLTFTTGATNTSAIIFLSQGVAGGIAYADLVVTK